MNARLFVFLSVLVWLGVCVAPVADAADYKLAPAGLMYPAVPDSEGLAGMAAAPVPMPDGSQVVVAAGGANFPEAKPWAGGKKVFHSAIYRLAGGVWSKVGDLPRPLAYAACAATANGLVIAGGCDAETHFAEVYLVSCAGKVSVLPALPEPVAYAAYAVEGRGLYVIGGSASPAATEGSASVYRLDLAKIDAGRGADSVWEKLPDAPFGGRILSIAGGMDGAIHVVGGCSLKAGAGGKAVRTYHADGATLVTTEKDPARVWSRRAPTPLPTPLAAAAAPAPAREGRLFVIGGDDGSRSGMSPQSHPGQRRDILAYDPRAGLWEKAGEWPEGLATAPVFIMDGRMTTVSGETAPGVRTPAVWSMTIGYSFTLHPVDWLVFGLGGAGVGMIFLQVRRKGLGRAVADTASAADAPGKAAWVAVGLLFVVAMLNYLDRQLLTTMQPPIVRDIPQTGAEFGMLTAVFLFTYSAISPVGGILADRFSRRLVILVSLLVWSAVTWLTGHVETYGELVVARALMGISEACYIPAALALITDFHRGKTRSLATGIHMSGIYLGQALAGLGGLVAESAGWRMTFGAFGLVGVVYALVLILFLKEPRAEAPEGTAPVAVRAARSKLGPGPILGGLFRAPAFWLLMAIMGCASISNWFILSWLPLLLKEKFNLSLAEAGTWATTPSSIAKYCAVILGALIADAWSRRDDRARSRLAGLAFLVAGPMVALCLCADTLPVFVACIVFQGVAQGVLDATLMPVLRTQIDARAAATGYGFLNLVGAGLGGLAVVYGGRLKDAGIPLATTLALSGAGLLVCGIALLLVPKPRSHD